MVFAHSFLDCANIYLYLYFANKKEEKMPSIAFFLP
jgi:hypothetical protein